MEDVDYGPFTQEGMRCRATKRIVAGYDRATGKNCEGDPKAVFPDPEHIHAEPGETGVVAGLDPSCGVTVRFDRTGTATLVGLGEVELVS